MSSPASPRIAVIYYSATGTVHRLAEAIADGAASTGAEVRLRRVVGLTPESAINANPDWRTNADQIANSSLTRPGRYGWSPNSPGRFKSPSSRSQQIAAVVRVLCGFRFGLISAFRNPGHHLGSGPGESPDAACVHLVAGQPAG